MSMNSTIDGSCSPTSRPLRTRTMEILSVPHLELSEIIERLSWSPTHLLYSNISSSMNLESRLVRYEIQTSFLALLSSPWIRLCILCLTLPLLTYYWRAKLSRLARQVNKFPGPNILPFLGNYNYFMCPPEDWQRHFSSFVREHGRCFRMWFASNPVIFVADGKIAEKVLGGFDNVQKGDNYVAFHRVLGQGLAMSEAKKWRKDRKVLNPGFGFQYFAGFVKIFNEQSKIMVDILQSEVANKPTNLLPFITRCTLDSVFNTVFGAKRDLQRNPNEQIAEKIYGLVHCTRVKLFQPWLHYPVIWHVFGLGRKEDALITSIMKDFDEIIEEKIEEKARTGSVSGTHTKPFLAFLLEATQDKEDIAFQINTLCATGAETTSSGLNYLLFLLSLNPEIQRKVQEEVDSIFDFHNGETESEGISLTLDDLSQMKYSEMCIKESLRLYPSVSGWFRKLQTDVVLDDKRVLPKGAQVGILPWDIHRNPEVFPDPEKFDPERFLPENKEKIGSSGWIAFSSGPRNCIGHRYGILQMKTMLAHTMRNFNISTTQLRENLRVIYGVVLEPVPAIQLLLTPRIRNSHTA